VIRLNRRSAAILPRKCLSSHKKNDNAFQFPKVSIDQVPISTSPDVLDSLADIVVHHPGLFLAWAVAVGAAVGSFLNVVVYRLPAGMNIAFPPSHCTTCRRPIRVRDNIPVLSWLLLRGKCRHCQSRISVRYPLVEAIVAVIFGIVASAVVRSFGFETPAEPPQAAIIAMARLGYYAVLPCCLLCLVLIDWDGHPVPRSLVLFGLTMAVVPPLLWPEIRLIPTTMFGSGPGYIRVVGDIGVGFLVGVLTGILAIRMGVTGANCPLFMNVILGAYLGWISPVVWGILSVVPAMIPRTSPQKRRLIYGSVLICFSLIDVFVRVSRRSST
jgi:leader peptidase (prepilin peptidase)/N-methyltransferase